MPRPFHRLPAARSIASAGLLMCSFLCQNALAQTYPEREIRLVVPFAPGGANDAIARVYAADMEPGWEKTSWSTTGLAPAA